MTPTIQRWQTAKAAIGQAMSNVLEVFDTAHSIIHKSCGQCLHDTKPFPIGLDPSEGLYLWMLGAGLVISHNDQVLHADEHMSLSLEKAEALPAFIVGITPERIVHEWSNAQHGGYNVPEFIQKAAEEAERRSKAMEAAEEAMDNNPLLAAIQQVLGNRNGVKVKHHDLGPGISATEITIPLGGGDGGEGPPKSFEEALPVVQEMIRQRRGSRPGADAGIIGGKGGLLGALLMAGLLGGESNGFSHDEES